MVARVAAACMISAAGAREAAAMELASAYQPIQPTSADHTVTLSGRGLTPEQLVDIARYGAKVRLGASARARAAATYGLLLEGAAEHVPIYAFNRGGGTNRQVVTFDGDPYSPENRAKLHEMQSRAFRNGPGAGVGPEMSQEEAVRAMMAVRANTLPDDGPSPQLLQMLLDLLNARIAPVVQSADGTVGDGDLSLMANVAGAMVGRGEVYYGGVRMAAAEALARAGLKPLEPFASDSSALTSTNAYTAGQAGLLVADAEEALRWADLAYGIDLLGMNSSITPLSWPVQANRPQRWLNWHAAHMLDMLQGSYLFQIDTKRTLADPDSLRASSIRQASAWQAWATLRDATMLQMNSSDHNPAIHVGAAPEQAWEMATPMLRQYTIRGGPYSAGRSGYIVTSANWDPYPLANQVEAFTIALANVDVAVAQRIYRFGNPFFTIIRPADVLTPAQLADAAPQANGTTVVALWQSIETEITPVPPVGIASDVQGNGDIESAAPRKVARARSAVRASLRLLAQDLLTGAYWMDVRKAEAPERSFGAAPTVLWKAFRQAVPWQTAPNSRPDEPVADVALLFMLSHPPPGFYAGGPPAP